MKSVAILSARPTSASRTRGYSIEKLPGEALPDEKDEKDKADWPVAPKDVHTPDQFNQNIKWLASRAQYHLAQWPVSSIECIKIGKTCVTGKDHAVFNPSDHTTWRYGDTNRTSPASRWGKYKANGYHCLLVLCCFANQDVPDVLKAMKMHQQHMALAYEFALDEYLTTFYKTAPTTSKITMASGDPGGGGRATLSQYKGGIVYMAIKLKPVVPLTPRIQTKIKPTLSQGSTIVHKSTSSSNVSSLIKKK